MDFKTHINSISDKSTSPRRQLLKKIAEETGKDISTVYRWLNGTNNPSLSEKKIISIILQRSVEELFPEKEEICK